MSVRKRSTRYFTIGEVAKICGVAMATVRKWCKKGYLEFFTIPPTKLHRRVTRRSLIKFMKEYSISGVWKVTEDMDNTILLIGEKYSVFDTALHLNTSIVLKETISVFQAGSILETDFPFCIVIDTAVISRVNLLEVFYYFKNNNIHDHVILVGIVYHDVECDDNKVNTYFDKCYKKGFYNGEELLQYICEEKNKRIQEDKERPIKWKKV